MNKTIFITGASSGIGKSTCRLFYEKGWNVVATMRNVTAEKELHEDKRLKLVTLDVLDKNSIKNAAQEALKAFGSIDVLLNNAGYGVVGPLEAGDDAQIRRQFDVNLFGVIDCMKAILPHFRANKSGVIINVASIGGLLAVPTFSAYCSTKFALEGLSESLWYELGALGISVKLIEPGRIKTDFSGRSLDHFNLESFPDYVPFFESVTKVFSGDRASNASSPELVAQTIYEAATDKSDKLRYLVGRDAKSYWLARRWLGYRFQMQQLKRMIKL